MPSFRSTHESRAEGADRPSIAVAGFPATGSRWESRNEGIAAAPGADTAIASTSLSEFDQRAFQQVCARFGSHVRDRFAGTEWYTSDLGLPVLGNALAAIHCSVADVVDGGDHFIVVGRVLALSESAGAGRPLLFYRGRYAAMAPIDPLYAAWHADLEYFLAAPSDSW
ncbi:flavin reductase family protein [Nocardia carnea]|uniref:Flavin reductase family protein n=1 Tax=Nocardia carnea TaxID=37328 RepID=A0ABW7THQ2_9NOCA|nr:flavin reductase family protein [Nocardia carnea]